eukprot:4352964-Alexandrium_andersonii.AAC.1
MEREPVARGPMGIKGSSAALPAPANGSVSLQEPGEVVFLDVGERSPRASRSSGWRLVRGVRPRAAPGIRAGPESAVGLP